MRPTNDAVEATQNLETFTSLLDSQFVASDRDLHAEYKRVLHRHVSSQRDWLAVDLNRRLCFWQSTEAVELTLTLPLS